ncbi:MAG TPA: helix-turn-helix transcriptional regulator [Lachnospiraceae bacterium]|nr:helix-turn-helix transcriptional regulator [Lachnospiraceae bacterium]
MLPETIKMIRQKAFLSQEAFASELKVSVSTINRWETGKVRPNLTAMKNIKQFCEKYSLSFEEVEREWFDYGKH